MKPASFVHILLGLSLIANPCVGIADVLTAETTTAPLSTDVTSPATLPLELREVAVRHAQDEAALPPATRKLLMRRVKSYFRAFAAPRVAPDPRAQLLNDVKTIFAQFEKEDTSGEFNGFIEQKLTPFIQSLNEDVIADPMRNGVLSEPIGEWNLQTLVVKEMVGYLGKYKDFSTRALELVSGKHLKGASYLGAMIAMWAGLHAVAPNWTTAETIGISLGIWELLKVGPLATVTTAATGFFVRPTTELVKTLGSRLTGDLEAHINHGYDIMVEHMFKKSNPANNDTVRIVSYEIDHTDFAGMSAEDQIKNWSRALNIFVLVQSTFGRLLRDTHHAGRDLMMLSWTDSQAITNLVEGLDTKALVLETQQMNILMPYRNAFINQKDFASKNEFDRRVRVFNDATEEVWLNPDADITQLDQIAAKIEAAGNSLREYGLSDEELKQLLDIQRKRGRSIGKLITGVSIGHMRGFYGAERNRNLVTEARVIAKAIQVGLGVEEYTERYLPLVRRQLRLMGIELNNEDKTSAVTDPVVIKHEECVIQSLRRALNIPRSASSEAYACMNALLRQKPYEDLIRDPNSPSAQILSQIRGQARRLEVAGILKFAAAGNRDAGQIQSAARAVLSGCH